MHDFTRKIKTTLEGVWRFRWPALLFAWVIAVLGWAFVLTLPDSYETRARVYVDVQTALKPLLQGLTVQRDVIAEVNLLTEALLSRPNLAKMVQDTDMDLRVSTPLEMKFLLDDLQKKIRIEAGNRNNLYDIRYQDIDPRMAQSVVQSLLNNLIDDTLGKHRTDAVTAQEFLTQQVEAYAARLAASELRLAEFKQTHVGIMPADAGQYYAELQVAVQRREQTKQALTLAQERLEDAQRQLAGEEPTFGLVPDAPVPQAVAQAPAALAVDTDADIKLRQAEEALSDLSSRYTDKYPDIIELKKRLILLTARAKDERAKVERAQQQLAQLQLQQQQQAVAQPLVETPLEENPVYQNIKVILNNAENEVAVFTTQAAEQQVEIDRLKKTVTTIPTVEADLTRLNRDYEATRSQYDQIALRLDTAKLSDDASKSSEIKFRIIEPPTVSLKPIGPNRPLFITIVLAVALVMALTLAFFIHQFRPVFINTHDLRVATGLPIFGTVTLKHRPFERMKLRMNRLSLATGMVILLSLYAGTLYFQEKGSSTVQALMASGKVAEKVPFLKDFL